MLQPAVSPRGLADIIRAEGIVLPVYEDINTKTGSRHRANGIGNVDDTLPLDLVISVEQAVATFKKNIERFNAVVDKVATRLLLQREKDALVSRAFNKGAYGFEHDEVALIERVNANDARGVVLELVSDANLTRRQREALLYTTGEYRDLNIAEGIRHVPQMVPLYRTNPRDAATKIEWIPLPHL